MSQISPPIRIVLAVAVLFMAAWMTVLKPKSDSPAPAPVTSTPAGNVNTGNSAVTNLGKAAEKAKDAAAATDKHNAAVTKSSDELSGDSTSAAGTTSANRGTEAKAGGAVASSALAGVPAGVVKAIKQQKVVVLGFVSGKAADDRAVQRALGKVDDWDGRVWVKVAPITRVAKYGRIARGVDVAQSPTIVVVDRELHATPLVGYVDARTIDQAIADALRNSGGVFTSAYLRKVNAVCVSYGPGFVSDPGAATAKRWKAFVADLAAVKAPARFASFKSGAVADARAMRGDRGAGRSFASRMDKRHVLGCTG